ncbi:unnamed protein product [Dovyalis caffra]|uniref:Uncharacterized protein n=1 Tax=Dovyalis caffra TaxID=77055 RepID=A0AAV1SS93_9ROSI|nr:unnamed protein product [Dovyalis caffra]
MQRIIRIQLISGMYIWLNIFFDVCTALTVGKQSTAAACLINEKVTVMVAWLATTAVPVAIVYRQKKMNIERLGDMGTNATTYLVSEQGDTTTHLRMSENSILDHHTSAYKDENKK